MKHIQRDVVGGEYVGGSAEMNPLFKITTPNGKYKIEGYEVDKFHYREESNETILINKGETPDVCVGKPYKLSDITEEMAKSWGYEERRGINNMLAFTSFEVFHYELLKKIESLDNYYSTSNILLIIIEDE